MSATNQAEQNALTLPERAAVALGESANAAKLRELAAKSAGIVTVTNAGGRAEAHRAGMVLRGTRTNIASTGKAAREDATAFSKAVIAMEKELILIIEPEETRVLALRDTFDAAEQTRKDALIAAERARTDAIHAVIQTIRDTPLRASDMDAAGLSRTIDALGRIEPLNGQFAEFSGDAAITINIALERVQAMLAKARTVEAAAHKAEQARIAEAARIEADRAELAKQRAENDRIAAEQAATAKRLADQEAAQALAARQLADKAAANLKAERDAQELAMRLEREKTAAAQAKARAEIEAAQAALAASQAAHKAAIAKQEEADKRNADHAEALDDNAAFDARAAVVAINAAHEAAVAELKADMQRNADHELALAMNSQIDINAADDLARCTETAQAMLTNGRSLITASLDAYSDAGLADDEPVIDCEAIAWAYQKLLAFGVGNSSMENALMLDRLNLMLLSAEVAA